MERISSTAVREAIRQISMQRREIKWLGTVSSSSESQSFSFICARVNPILKSILSGQMTRKAGLKI
jgi:hypothetical protein